MITGSIKFDNEIYKCNISDKLLHIYIQESEMKYWEGLAKSNGYIFEQNLFGEDSNNLLFQVKSKSFKAIPLQKKSEELFAVVKVNIDYLVVWSSGESEDSIVDGISVNLDSTDTFSSTNKKLEGINNQWSYNSELFIWKSDKQIVLDEALSKIYDLVNTLRFLCQLNKVGSMQFNLLHGSSIIGNIKYCKYADDYCNGNTPNTLLETIQVLSPMQFEKLVSKMSQREIYMAHIEQNIIPRPITVGWFITVMAAFEWEWRVFSFEQTHSDRSKNEQNEVLQFLDNKIKDSSRKSRKHFEAYKAAIIMHDEFVSLGEKIRKILEDKELTSLWEPLFAQVYELYTDQCSPDLIAKRLNKQRNDFAHGNLDIDIEPLSIIDIGILRRMIYILQLNKCKLENRTIQSCYETVFGEKPYSKQRALEELDNFIKNLGESKSE